MPVHENGKAARLVDTKPGVVSKRIKQLRNSVEPPITKAQLAKLSGVSAKVIGSFEDEYEPPLNHPMFPKLASGLAKALNRPVKRFTDELSEGGYTAKFSNTQLAMIHKAGKSRAPRSAKPEHVQARVDRAEKAEKLDRAVTTGVVDERAALRELVHSFNAARSTGEIIIPIPTDKLYPFLAEYLDMKHIGRECLLAVDVAARLAT